MMAFGVSLRKMFRRFRQDDHGSATIEAVIWMPIFVLILCLVADAALIFGKQAQVMRVVQDANRAMSIGRIMNTADAQTYIRQRIATLSPNATVATVLQSGVIVTTVTMPSSDLTATGLISSFTSINVRVTAQQMSEA
jgi:Flp pilus assembly protein TadG